jgi:hypothetical protein
MRHPILSRVAVLGPVLLIACGLLAWSGSAQAMTKDQQKCINTMNKNLQKVAAAAGKEANACVKNATKGAESDPAGCLTRDAAGKVQKATAKTDADYTKKCIGRDKSGTARLPSFGVTDPDTVNQVAKDKELTLIADIFGSDLASALADPANKKDGKCQQTVIKDTLKCQDTYTKTFNREKKNALKAGTVADASDLAALFGNDPKGKISKACGKISQDIGKKCAETETPLSELFPGCAPGDAGELVTCLENTAECLACATISAADGLVFDCPACGAPSFGVQTCYANDNKFCVGGPLDGEPCTDILLHTDCPSEPNDPSRCLNESSVFLNSHVFGVPFLTVPLIGTMEMACGAPNPVTGVVQCDCDITDLEGVTINPIGHVCFQQGTEPCPVTTIDCDGGAPIDLDMVTAHDIGFCGLGDDPNDDDIPGEGPQECIDLCEAYCADLGGIHKRTHGQCEGYCTSGPRMDIPCETDSECPGGDCAGGEPVAHENRCFCHCLETGGIPGDPGSAWCSMRAGLVIEYDPPCDELDVNFSTEKVCVSITTEDAQGLVVNAGAVPGQTIGPLVAAGESIPCPERAANGPAGTTMVGYVGFMDSGLGDMLARFQVTCGDPP